MKGPDFIGTLFLSSPLNVYHLSQVKRTQRGATAPLRSLCETYALSTYMLKINWIPGKNQNSLF